MFHKPLIENPNSSGQGDHHDGPAHKFAEICLKFGYVYSHSVPVCMRGGCWELFHYFKHPTGEHSVGLRSITNTANWQTCVTPATARKHYGTGAEDLEKHLKSKASRYGLKKAIRKTLPDARYTVNKEGTGDPLNTWVARFCGELLAAAPTEEKAIKIARHHRTLFLRALPLLGK